MVLLDQAAIIDVGENAHKESRLDGQHPMDDEISVRRQYSLAIHPVCHTAVSRDAVAEVLDVERALEPRSEETAKWCNEGRKACKDEKVELVGRVRDRGPAAQLRYKGDISRALNKYTTRLTTGARNTRSGRGMSQSRQMKTGLGLQCSSPLQALTPRSSTGQIM